MHAAVLPTLESTPEWLGDVVALYERLPVPDAASHRGAAEIAAVRYDFRRALRIVRRHAGALARLEELLSEHEVPATLSPPSDSLASAFHRLASLPRPDGQHPYLDVIAPALEAAACVLAAVAADEDARAEFNADVRF